MVHGMIINMFTLCMPCMYHVCGVTAFSFMYVHVHSKYGFTWTSLCSHGTFACIEIYRLVFRVYLFIHACSHSKYSSREHHYMFTWSFLSLTLHVCVIIMYTQCGNYVHVNTKMFTHIIVYSLLVLMIHEYITLQLSCLIM